MKIEKRGNNNPLNTIQIWAVPAGLYVLLKALEASANYDVRMTAEWVWWITIPFFATVWFFYNWRIKK